MEQYRWMIPLLLSIHIFRQNKMRQNNPAKRGLSPAATTRIPRQQQIFQKTILWASEYIRRILGLRRTDMTEQPTQDDAVATVPAAAEVAEDNLRIRKLPPLDIRPFQAQDYNQIRQLIADSIRPLFAKKRLTYIRHPAAWTTRQCPHLLPSCDSRDLGSLFSPSHQRVWRFK
jgi:hypothetical protein